MSSSRAGYGHSDHGYNLKVRHPLVLLCRAMFRSVPSSGVARAVLNMLNLKLLLYEMRSVSAVYV